MFGTAALSDGSGVTFYLPCGNPSRAREQSEMFNSLFRTELPFKLLGLGLAKVCLRIGAETGPNCMGKSQIRQVEGVKMRELAARHRHVGINSRRSP
jgi:hypothetical protein